METLIKKAFSSAVASRMVDARDMKLCHHLRSLENAVRRVSDEEKIN
jgi:hypothetical protein